MSEPTEQRNKRDFGSFHASNVQELINIPEEDYSPPELPIKSPAFLFQQDELQFGKEAREKHFLLEGSCTFLNHGAFGGVLKEALDATQQWQRYTESQPLRFYDRELLPHLVYVTRRLAKFVDCDPRDLVLMTNATTGINSVIRSFDFKTGDVIFMFSNTYGAVKKLVRQVCVDTGAVVSEVTVNFPLEGPQQLIDLVKDNLDGNKTKLAIFDHIPSNTPYITPLSDIIQICHQRNVPVLVDGAHALGSIPLSLRTLQPDFYVSNAHKWLCSPKGAAFLYVAKQYQESTRPLVISHGFGSGFNSEFIWAGLHDYSPFLSLHTLLDFWLSVGVNRIQHYIYRLVTDAANLLTTSWDTGLAAPLSMFGSMALVQLPHLQLFKDCDTLTYCHAEQVQNMLYHEHCIEVPIKAIQGRLYVRISAHIYNSLEEYEKLAAAVLQLSDIAAS
ncbi:uncharacterized protein [Haliotis cracherodii]|uniref:uncharacterized protein n=1 Tax=Haliotis cracherodii TaxID=6455 RepID=UPI0039EB40A5